MSELTVGERDALLRYVGDHGGAGARAREAALRRGIADGYPFVVPLMNDVVDVLTRKLGAHQAKALVRAPGPYECRERTAPRAEAFAALDAVRARASELEVPSGLRMEVGRVSRLETRDGRCTPVTVIPVEFHCAGNKVVRYVVAEKGVES